MTVTPRRLQKKPQINDWYTQSVTESRGEKNVEKQRSKIIKLDGNRAKTQEKAKNAKEIAEDFANKVTLCYQSQEVKALQ